MGFGDDIMAVAYAKRVREKFPDAKMVFGNPDTFHDSVNNKLNIHWSEVFFGNPNIVQPGESVKETLCIPDYPGHRQYIDYDNCKKGGGKKYAFRDDFSAPRGELFFSDMEKTHVSVILSRLPKQFIVMEPEVKGAVSGKNKAWPSARWLELAEKTGENTPILQLGAGENFLLKDIPGVTCVTTPSFREACLILNCASGFVGTDGGLHHAAAAMNIPAVVLWSHYSPPEILGYSDHTNIRKAEGYCGSLKPCEDCKKSMEAIETGEVLGAIEGMLNAERN